jgi:1-acyl-sn-glycerol-3-phosphate acyltransferase
MSLGGILGLVVSALCLWVVVVGVASWLQERKVGWKPFKSHAKFLLFHGATCGPLTALMLPTFAWSLVRGDVGACKLANDLLRLVFFECSKAFWGPFAMEGVENLPPGDEGVIYVANHQTSIDMPLGFCLPNRPHLVGVGKTSILALPGAGPLFWLQGAVFVSRGKHGQLAMLVEKGTKALKRGMSVAIFPQGTRKVATAGKPLLPFKIGAFKLAVESKARIVPLTFVFPTDFMDSRPKKPGMRFIIHPPIEPGKDPDALMRQVEGVVLGPLQEATGALPPEPQARPQGPAGKKKD